MTEAEELELLELENENAHAAQGAPPGALGAFAGGFRGEDRLSGLSGANVAEELGRGALPILFGTIGAAGGPAVSALGAAAGRAAQNAAQAAMTGQDLGVGGAMASPAIEGATQFLGGKVVQHGVAPAARALAKRAAGTIGGMAGEAFERLVARPAQVLSDWARDPDTAKEVGGVFKEAVKTNLKRAGEAYEAIIERALRGTGAAVPGQPSLPGMAPAAPPKFNLLDAVGGKLAKISDDFGFANPNRLTANVEGADVFRSINSKIQGLTEATAEDVYYLQRDLGTLARQYEGKPLGAALKRTRAAVMEHIGTALPEIGEANRLYATAKNLDDLAESFVNVENFPAKIAHAYRQNTSVKDAAESIASGIPAAREALEKMRDAIAGQAFAPAMASIPRTGLASGLGALGLGAAGMNPLALGGAVVAAPFMSPRVTGALVGGASRLGQYAMGPGAGPAALQRAYAGAGTAAAAPASQALMEAYHRRLLGGK